MKKTALALTIILMLFFFVGSSSNGPLLVRIAEANPYTPPNFTVYSPKNNTVYGTNSLKFSFKIDPPVDYDYYYSLDEQIEMRHITLEKISHIDPFFGPLPAVLHFSNELADLSDGQHKLTIHHQYNDQFIPDWRITVSDVTIIFYVDTVAPTITDLSVNNTDSGDKLLSFTVEEASWVSYSLDNLANVTVNGEVVLKDLPVGSHNVTVYAEDEAGNMGASETLFFTVEEPFPTTLVITSAVIIIVIVVAVFLLYQRKHKH